MRVSVARGAKSEVKQLTDAASRGMANGDNQVEAGFAGIEEVVAVGRVG